MRVGDDGMASVDGAVVEIKEPLRLALPHQITGVLIGAAQLDLPGLRLSIGGLQRLLAMLRTILGNGGFQRCQVLLRLDPNLAQIELILVGIGLQVRRIGAPVARPLFTASSTISSKIS
jgi:hypothetical protein